jgi:type I restriction enzyme R subunit
MARTEADTRAELIDPALKKAGWGVVTNSRVRREYPITSGRLIGSGGKREKKLIADYVLKHKGRNLIVLEAKAENKHYTEGLTQAKEYADRLDTRFACCTNGRQFYWVDMKTGKESDIATFPSPEAVWKKAFPKEGKWRDIFLNIDYKLKPGDWHLRYYQGVAVTRAMEAIAQDQKRILLTLATGTGKTEIAFQIAWKLYQSSWTLAQDQSRRPRILFLADRNILADQAYSKFASYGAFPESSLVRMKPEDIRKKGSVLKNGSVFFTIFQTTMSGGNEASDLAPYFNEYNNDFFDVVIVDECHRGGANDESLWRSVLDHFSSALQIGLTATPKRKTNADTYAYFGEPVYTYSLKTGINDGFLTPFKVKSYSSNVDGYTVSPEDEILRGHAEVGDSFQERDFNTKVEIREREESRVKQFMPETGEKEKTLVFCARQEHASLIRDLINQHKKEASVNFCVRVTADEGERGEQFLREFQDNDKSVPTILTTSQKLSTGVDARNIRHIVLLRPVNNIVEFKQIIGRGTRLYETKDYFTLHDFVKASVNFSDPEWDGEPLPPDEPEPSTPKPDVPELPEPSDQPVPDPNPGGEKKEIIKIKMSDGNVRNIQFLKATSFWDTEGRPINAQKFINRLYGTLPRFFKDEDELREIWGSPDSRNMLLKGLSDNGFSLDLLMELRRAIEAEQSDIYDVLAFIRFSLPMKAQHERAEQAKRSYSESLTENQKSFLDFILDQYVNEGFTELDFDKLPELIKIQYQGSSFDGINALGGDKIIKRLFQNLQKSIYN